MAYVMDPELQQDEPQADPMSDREIAHVVDQWREQGINDDQDEISSRRQRILDYYSMEPYPEDGGDWGNEGYSQVVTAEVLETVEWCKPSIARVFLHGEPCKFRALNADDQELAEQETAVVNWVLRQVADYFSEVMQWTHDGLLYPNAYLKVWWDKRTEKEFSDYEGLTAQQLIGLQSDPNVEIVRIEETSEQHLMSDGMGGSCSTKATRTFRGEVTLPVYTTL